LLFSLVQSVFFFNIFIPFVVQLGQYGSHYNKCIRAALWWFTECFSMVN